jgi:flagellar basal-body rod modification protein FlgD
MDGLQPVSSGPLFLGPASAGAPSQSENPFLNLLVSQLRNQDPLSPLGGTEFVGQLAQFSSLEQAQALNVQIAQLVSLQQALAGIQTFSQSAALVGRTVEYTDPATDETRTGFVSGVRVEDGEIVLDIDGAHIPISNVTAVLAGPASPPPSATS